MDKQQLVNFLKNSREAVPDAIAVQAKELYPIWKAGETVKAGDRRQYGDKLYKVLQDHTTQADWTPDVSASLWAVIDVTHAGTQEDPIPYSLNMEVFNGKYYTYEGVMYKCIRDSGIALQNAPGELLGNYFELAA